MAVNTTYVMARPGAKCQVRAPGCTYTATLTHIAYPAELLGKWGRDPDYADQWLAVCSSCASTLQEGS